jgi:hypothetical protein
VFSGKVELRISLFSERGLFPRVPEACGTLSFCEHMKS